jgi:MbtH protein
LRPVGTHFVRGITVGLDSRRSHVGWSASVGKFRKGECGDIYIDPRGRIGRRGVEAPVDQDQAIVTYDVVINDEEQYSIWPADRPIPAGWRAVGVRDTEETCLAYIEEHWTDMRPRSVRLAMQAGDAP